MEEAPHISPESFDGHRVPGPHSSLSSFPTSLSTLSSSHRCDDRMRNDRDEMVTVDLGDGAQHSPRQKKQEHLKEQVQTVLQRETDLQGLARDAVELKTVFDDFALTVEGQGTLINETEANIAEAKQGHAEAADELVKAEAFRRSWKKKKIYIAIAVVLILIVIILIVVLTVG